jgi:hypothetical protein
MNEQGEREFLARLRAATLEEVPTGTWGTRPPRTSRNLSFDIARYLPRWVDHDACAVRESGGATVCTGVDAHDVKTLKGQQLDRVPTDATETHHHGHISRPTARALDRVRRRGSGIGEYRKMAECRASRAKWAIKVRIGARHTAESPRRHDHVLSEAPVDIVAWENLFRTNHWCTHPTVLTLAARKDGRDHDGLPEPGLSTQTRRLDDP